MPPTTVDEALRCGSRALPRRAGIPDPKREAVWLLAHAWGVTETWLRLRPHHELPDEVAARFDSWVSKRAAGVPAHHLSGRCIFCGRDLEVSPAVLIPRPETELLVKVALSLPLPSTARVVDVGTGSGCIAVTLAAERPRWQVFAVDSNLAPLAVARRNIIGHGVRVPLLSGDLGAAFGGAFNLVVANLPYVPRGMLASLPLEVRREPREALDGGPDGLVIVRRLVADLRRLLKPCGGAVLEIGEDQAEAVAEAAQGAGLGIARRVRDLGGCERIIVLEPR